MKLENLKRLVYNNLIKFHTKMRSFYDVNPQLHNPMKVIFHDMRVQKYECKLEKMVAN